MATICDNCPGVPARGEPCALMQVVEASPTSWSAIEPFEQEIREANADLDALCFLFLSSRLKRWFAALALRDGITLADCWRFDRLYWGEERHSYASRDGCRPGISPSTFFTNSRRYCTCDKEAHGRVRLHLTQFQADVLGSIGDPWPLALPPRVFSAGPRVDIPIVPIGPEFPRRSAAYLVMGQNLRPSYERVGSAYEPVGSDSYREVYYRASDKPHLVSGAALCQAGIEGLDFIFESSASYVSVGPGKWVPAQQRAVELVGQVAPEVLRDAQEAQDYLTLLRNACHLKVPVYGYTSEPPHAIAITLPFDLALAVKGPTGRRVRATLGQAYRLTVDNWPSARAVLRTLKRAGRALTQRELAQNLRHQNAATLPGLLGQMETAGLVSRVQRKPARGPAAVAWVAR
jgi:hypothetical protein